MGCLVPLKICENRAMFILFLLLTLLTGLSIPLLPLLSAFFPRLGLAPLRWGHSRAVRAGQVALLWVFAVLSLAASAYSWGWAAVLLALGFSAAAARFYPERIFVALEQPRRAQSGLSAAAPVLAAALGSTVVAYPLETLVPHHIINDLLAEMPALAAW